jgi:hypothetical protein
VCCGDCDLLAHYEIGCEDWQGKDKAKDRATKGVAWQSRNQIRKKFFTTKDPKSTKF